MAWDKSLPIEGALAPTYNDIMRANQMALEAALDAYFHFATGGTQTGQPRQGSARPYFQDAAPTARLDGDYFDSTDLGTIWIDSNSTPDNQFNILTAADGAGTETWTPISTEIIAIIVAQINTWALAQTFSVSPVFTKGLVANNSYIQGRNKADSGNINIAKVNASDEIEMGAVTQLPDTSRLATSGAPTADAQLTNKKYVDKGSIKSFVNFDGDTGTINGTALNTTVARTDTGKYTLTWGTNFDSANYAIGGFCSDSVMSAGYICNESSDTPLAAGSAQIETRNYSGSLRDYSLVVVFAMGNQ